MADKRDSKTDITQFTKYEKARIIGSRALQISMGAPLMIALSKEGLEKLRFNPIEIAKMEFSEGKIPIGVIRPMPGRRKAREAQAAKAGESAE